jgi:hypothetical protein
LDEKGGVMSKEQIENKKKLDTEHEKIKEMNTEQIKDYVSNNYNSKKIKSEQSKKTNEINSLESAVKNSQKGGLPQQIYKDKLQAEKNKVILKKSKV